MGYIPPHRHLIDILPEREVGRIVEKLRGMDDSTGKKSTRHRFGMTLPARSRSRARRRSSFLGSQRGEDTREILAQEMGNGVSRQAKLF